MFYGVVYGVFYGVCYGVSYGVLYGVFYGVFTCVYYQLSGRYIDSSIGLLVKIDICCGLLSILYVFQVRCLL